MLRNYLKLRRLKLRVRRSGGTQKTQGLAPSISDLHPAEQGLRADTLPGRMHTFDNTERKTLIVPRTQEALPRFPSFSAGLNTITKTQALAANRLIQNIIWSRALSLENVA